MYGANVEITATTSNVELLSPMYGANELGLIFVL